MLFQTLYQIHFLLYEYCKHAFSQHFLNHSFHSFHSILNNETRNLQPNNNTRNLEIFNQTAPVYRIEECQNNTSIENSVPSNADCSPV